MRQILLAVTIISFVIVVVALIYATLMLWVASKYLAAQKQYRLSINAYAQLDTPAGDRYQAAGDAIAANADKWARRLLNG